MPVLLQPSGKCCGHWNFQPWRQLCQPRSLNHPTWKSFYHRILGRECTETIGQTDFHVHVAHFSWMQPGCRNDVMQGTFYAKQHLWESVPRTVQNGASGAPCHQEMFLNFGSIYWHVDGSGFIYEPSWLREARVISPLEGARTHLHRIRASRAQIDQATSSTLDESSAPQCRPWVCWVW